MAMATINQRTLVANLLTLLLAASLFATIVSSHPVSASHLWPEICEPLTFREFLSVSRTTGQPVSLGPEGFYIHFGNAHCLFFKVASSDSDGKFAFYRDAFVSALK